MKRRTFLASAGSSMVLPKLVGAQADPGATPVSTPAETGYAPANGLEMYYEIHGTGGTPLVLLHGAFNTINMVFSGLIPEFAKTRQVIAFELQGHGHTGDVDRPITYEHLADDVAAALDHLGIAQVDILGYSMGGGAAIQFALRHPEKLRKVVSISAGTHSLAIYPEVLANIELLTPDLFAGSPIETEYQALNPNPENFPVLVEKIKVLDATLFAWLPADIQAIKAPMLIMIGDSDVVQPAHALEMFKLLGGGVPGDLVPMPATQLAILPGATHISVMFQSAIIAQMATPFLDAETAT